MTDMGVIFLLFLMKAALADDYWPKTNETVYVVFYDGSIFDGVYEAGDEGHELHFKKLGKADSYGDKFIYTDSRRPQSLIIGYGETFSTVVAKYRAPAVNQWSDVFDGSREGKEESSSLPSFRVDKVERGAEDIITEEYIICKTKHSHQKIISSHSNDSPFCSHAADCDTGYTIYDKLCPNHNIFDVIMEQGLIFCEGSKERWLILGKSDCRRCNKFKDCAGGHDELNCPAYVSPSFELPVYCCLLVLLLGTLFYLGWKSVTKAAVDESKEMETISANSLKLEKAIDLIVEAAIENLPFPTARYKIIHKYCGGIELLIGPRYGKRDTYCR